MTFISSTVTGVRCHRICSCHGTIFWNNSILEETFVPLAFCLCQDIEGVSPIQWIQVKHPFSYRFTSRDQTKASYAVEYGKLLTALTWSSPFWLWSIPDQWKMRMQKTRLKVENVWAVLQNAPVCALLFKTQKACFKLSRKIVPQHSIQHWLFPWFTVWVWRIGDGARQKSFWIEITEKPSILVFGSIHKRR